MQPDTVVNTYDNQNLTQVRVMNNTYSFTYNAIGNVTQRTDPSGKNDQYFFDDQGQPTRWINRRGDTVRTTYDVLHRRLVKSGSKVVPDTMRYANTGLYVVASNKNAYDSTTVDATGFVTQVFTKFGTGAQTFTRSYSKTATGRFDQVTMSTTSGITFANRKFVWKDQTGVLDTIRLNGQVVDQIGYNAALQRIADNYAGGQTRRDSLTSVYQPYEIAFSQVGADSLLWRSSFLDAAGRITTTFAVGANQPTRRAYGYAYDNRGRLTSTVDTVRTYTGTWDVADDADFGEKLGTTYTKGFLWRDSVTYDSLNNIKTVNGPTVATYTKNRIVTFPSYNFTTDFAGNVTQRAKTTGVDTTKYWWSADGLLDSVKVNARTMRYDYNAYGQLVRKRLSGNWRHFLWDQGHLMAEMDSALTSRVAEYAYFPGTDRPLAILTGATTISKTRFLQQDSQGNVIGADSATTIDGVVIENDPWGSYWYTLPGLATSDTNRLRLKGMVYEADSVNLYRQSPPSFRA